MAHIKKIELTVRLTCIPGHPRGVKNDIIISMKRADSIGLDDSLFFVNYIVKVIFSNDDDPNPQLDQGNDTLSREQLLSENNKDPDIKDTSVVRGRQCWKALLHERRHPYAKLTTQDKV